MSEQLLAQLVGPVSALFLAVTGLIAMWRYLTKLIDSKDKTSNDRIDILMGELTICKAEHLKAKEQIETSNKELIVLRESLRKSEIEIAQLRGELEIIKVFKVDGRQ